MDEISHHVDVPLCAKIARLVQERGWNQEAFARQAELNRLTVRSIFLGPSRKLHNATVCACARALGVSVHDLLTQPLDKLLPRMRVPLPARESLRLLYEQATQPELLAWLQSNPERAAELTVEEIDELLSLQGTGGPLTEFGVAHYVEQIERRRKLLEHAAVIAGTEYIDLLEQFVGLLYEKIQPYRDRGAQEPRDV
jgi:transcriptional regulator with XRE-family HTH domain